MPFFPLSNILPALENKAVPCEELRVHCFSIVVRHLKRKDHGLYPSGIWEHSHPSQLTYCLKRISCTFLREKPKQLRINTHVHICALKFLDFFSPLDFRQAVQGDCCSCRQNTFWDFLLESCQQRQRSS